MKGRKGRKAVAFHCAAGNELIAWLLAVNVRDAQLASALGVGASALSNWLTGRNRMPLEQAIAIERATGGRIPASAWVDPAAIDRKAASVAEMIEVPA